jgi:hypothetical protein
MAVRLSISNLQRLRVEFRAVQASLSVMGRFGGGMAGSAVIHYSRLSEAFGDNLPILRHFRTGDQDGA